MQTIIIGIVSHNHYEYIYNNLELKSIANLPNVILIVKDNVGDIRLKEYCIQQGYEYIVSEYPIGFGENNNSIFRYAKENFKANPNDWFLIINPDVVIEEYFFKLIVAEIESENGDFFVPDLYKDKSYNVPDNSIRYFINFSNLLNPIFLKPINKAYNKSKLRDYEIVEWAAGSFLCIKFRAFEEVNGFDTRYFMYYEDVDLCYRLKQKNIFLRFLKNVKAVHVGQHKNRTFFSKHFFWYMASLFKFLRVRLNNY